MAIERPASVKRVDDIIGKVTATVTPQQATELRALEIDSLGAYLHPLRMAATKVQQAEAEKGTPTPDHELLDAVRGAFTGLIKQKRAMDNKSSHTAVAL